MLYLNTSYREYLCQIRIVESFIFARLTRNVEVVGSSPINGPVVSLGKKLYPYYLVLVGSRNRFELNFTIELK